MISNQITLVEEAGGKALPCIVDVRDENQVRSAIKSAVDKVILWYYWLSQVLKIFFYFISSEESTF